MHLPTTLRPLWVAEAGPESDVVISSRCRIARNVAGYPFPWRASEDERGQIARAILEARSGCPGLSLSEQIERDAVGWDDLVQLLAWRYVSRDWVAPGSGRWVIVARDRVSSVMVNEEDHLRFQAVLPGLQVESVYARASRIERELAGVLSFARNAEVGVLTASLANAGTGIRVSALLHLPGLAATGRLEATLTAAGQLGYSVRGAYGEGSEGTGDLFQVSNTRALGLHPEDTVARIAVEAHFLVEAERSARREQFECHEGRERLKAAVLEAVRTICAEPAGRQGLLPLVSRLRLGVAEGLLAAHAPEVGEWFALAGIDAMPASDSPSNEERIRIARRAAMLRNRVYQVFGGETAPPFD